MQRRTFLTAALVAAVTAAAGSVVARPFEGQATVPPAGAGGARLPSRNDGVRNFDPPPAPVHFAAPSLDRRYSPGGPIFGLPGEGNLIALTVDDGGSSEVIAAYARWCAETGMRVTFFLNGSLAGWTEQAALLAPLVANGQVQLGNHTWSHANLTSLTDQGIQDELMTNDEFIRSTYGVDTKPYFRPPFGYYDDRVLAAAAAVGYTVPTLWYGSLSDSGEIPAEILLQYARDYLLPQAIVIGHANYLPVTTVFPQIAQILLDRGLQPVTLDDVWHRP